MKAVDELVRSLSMVLGWDKRRLECLVQSLFSLFAVRSVNRQELSVGFGGFAKVESNYKRLYRFFAYFKIDMSQIALWIFKLFFPKDTKIYLTMDRTNWEFGKEPVNVLMLGIAYEGMSIPLLWDLLPKRGTCNTKERKALVKRFIDQFGKECIEGLLCDREFIGESWFEWLIRQEIPFYIRIKNNTLIRAGKKKLWEAKKIFRFVSPGNAQVFGMSVEIGRNKVYLAGSRSERGELMVVATNIKLRVKQAISIYLRRWEVECLFQGLKSRGFRFEDTHMTKPEHIEKLLVLLALGFTWAHRIGEFKAQTRPIALKRHKDGQLRPQNSYFRYGFDFIRHTILNQEKSSDENLWVTLFNLLIYKKETPLEESHV